MVSKKDEVILIINYAQADLDAAILSNATQWSAATDRAILRAKQKLKDAVEKLLRG